MNVIFFGVAHTQYLFSPILNDFFKVTSYGDDLDGKRYINSVEAYDYPIFGVQFHPELISYTNHDLEGSPNSIEAIRIAFQFSLFIKSQVISRQSNFKWDRLNKYDMVNTYTKTPEFHDEKYYYKFEKIK